MKNQALFSSKDKSKKLKCLLKFLFGALRVNRKKTTKYFFGSYLYIWAFPSLNKRIVRS